MHQRSAMLDSGFRNLTRAFAILVLLIIAGIFASLVAGSWPAIRKFGFGFLTSTSWNPVTEEFGALTPIVGTLMTSLIAMVIAVPVSFGIALFITELAPGWIKKPLGIAIELLAAIPSIIYGMWGLLVLSPFLARHIQPWVIQHASGIPILKALLSGPPMGIGVLTAGLILAIMIIPFIASIMRDVFEIVPPVLKESAYAMGCTTWEVMWNVVLPYTKVGVTGGVMLGLGRALGETMAVTFVIGNAHRLSASLFMPGNTISSALANEFTEADGVMYTSSLVALGLILFFITIIVLALARMMLTRLQRGEGSQA